MRKIDWKKGMIKARLLETIYTIEMERDGRWEVFIKGQNRRIMIDLANAMAMADIDVRLTDDEGNEV